MQDDQDHPSGGELLLYQTADGRTRIECRFEHETIWLTQAQMAELFQTTPQNITLHLKAIYAEGEQPEDATFVSLTYKFAAKANAPYSDKYVTIGWKSCSPSASASAPIAAPSSANGPLRGCRNTCSRASFSTTNA